MRQPAPKKEGGKSKKKKIVGKLLITAERNYSAVLYERIFLSVSFYNNVRGIKTLSDIFPQLSSDLNGHRP